MRESIGSTTVLAATLHLSPAYGIEYNEPQPVQKFPGSGWLINSRNEPDFGAYVQAKQQWDQAIVTIKGFGGQEATPSGPDRDIRSVQ